VRRSLVAIRAPPRQVAVDPQLVSHSFRAKGGSIHERTSSTGRGGCDDRRLVAGGRWEFGGERQWTRTVAKLDGLYVFTARGFTNTLDVARPVAIIELIRFNGDGTLDVPGGTVSINGNVFTAGGTGTYTVGDLIPPDGICVGTVTFLPIGIHFNSFIPSDDAKEFWMIRTDSGMCSRGR
jgi:hypothetical protein